MTNNPRSHFPRRFVLLAAAILAVVLTASGVGAQTTQPSPGTPKAALLDYDKALHDGDGPAIRDMLLTTNPTEEAVAAAMVDTGVTFAELQKKATAKFGAAASNAAFGDRDEVSREADQAVIKATETITGDTAAVVANAGPQGTINLKKVDGKWKLAFTAAMKNVDPANVKLTLDGTKKTNAIIRQLASDIEAGKFTTAEAARAALDDRTAPVKAEVKEELKAAAATKPS